MSETYLSVIIPAYNEAANIVVTLNEVIAYAGDRFGDAWEIIVVDDGSVDDTCALVENIRSRTGRLSLLRNEKNMGKGASVRKGIHAASGSICLFMDADNSTGIAEFDRMRPLLDRGADIVISSRKLKSSVITKRQPFARRFMSMVHHWMVNIMLGTRVSDYNCGFKAFRAAAAKRLFSCQRIDRWVFDAEIIFLAKKCGYAIEEVPVTWHHKDTSKVSAVKDSFDSFVRVLTIRINDLKGYYKEG